MITPGDGFKYIQHVGLLSEGDKMMLYNLRNADRIELETDGGNLGQSVPCTEARVIASDTELGGSEILGEYRQTTLVVIADGDRLELTQYERANGDEGVIDVAQTDTMRGDLNCGTATVCREA